MTLATVRDGEVRAGRDPATWVVCGVLVAPLLTAAIAQLTKSGLVTGDLALIELAIRDTGTGNTPLVGPFSRYGWNHPGPLMFWMLAPLYRVLGSDAQAMYAATAIVNATGLSLLAWIARRLGGRRLLAAVGLGAMLLTHGAGTTLVDPWNPYFAVVPFAVFMLAAASIANGDHVLVPLALWTGSLVVQSHISYVVPVAVVAAFCVCLLWMARRPPDHGEPADVRRFGTGIAASGALVLIASWSGPVLDQVRNSPGNLAQVAGFFLGVDVTGNIRSDESVGGLRVGLGSLGRQLHVFGPWAGGEEVASSGATVALAGAWWAVPLLASLAGVLWWSRVRGKRALTALGGVTAGGVFGAVVASMRVQGEPYWYLLRFWWPVAMLAWVAIAWWVLCLVPSSRNAARRGVAVVAVAALTVTALNATTLSRGPELPSGSRAVSAMADDVAGSLLPGGTYLVEPSGWSLFWEMLGFVNMLDARGFVPVASQTFSNHLGEARVLGGDGTPSVVDGRLIVAMNGSAEELSMRADLELLAMFDPLTPPERSEARELTSLARVALGDHGRTDLADGLGNIPLNLLLAASDVSPESVGIPTSVATRLGELEGRGALVAVYLGAP